MQPPWIYRSLQASLLASAALLVMPAGAQTSVPDNPATAATPAGQAMPATPRMQNRPQRAEKRHSRHTPTPRHSRYNHAGEPPNADRLATDRGASAADYERNALSRCDNFKMQEQKNACLQRMRQAPQGSVQGGGLLREYSYEVPAN